MLSYTVLLDTLVFLFFWNISLKRRGPLMC